MTKTMRLELRAGSVVDFADEEGGGYLLRLVKAEFAVFTRFVGDEMQTRVYLSEEEAIFCAPSVVWGPEEKEMARQMILSVERVDLTEEKLTERICLGIAGFVIHFAHKGLLDGYHLAFRKVEGKDLEGGVAVAVSSGTATRSQIAAESN